jgi:hypothetical protein
MASLSLMLEVILFSMISGKWKVLMSLGSFMKQGWQPDIFFTSPGLTTVHLLARNTGNGLKQPGTDLQQNKIGVYIKSL